MLIAFASCNEHVQLEEDSSEFKFQKELTIHDASGNSANLLIHANSEEALADQTADVLYLTTTTRDFAATTDMITEFENSSEIDLVEENEVFVMVTSYNIASNVTGFSVRSKLEFIHSEEISTRASSTDYQYSYGSSGTTGVWAEYASQTCNKEFLETTLSKKNSSGSLFWNKLGSSTLNSPGDDWTQTGSVAYYKFRLKIKAKKQCSGNATYYYNWLT